MVAGNAGFLNVAMIGALMAAIGAPLIESMAGAVKDLLPKDKESLYPMEMNALYEGMNFIKKERIDNG